MSRVDQDVQRIIKAASQHSYRVCVIDFDPRTKIHSVTIQAPYQGRLTIGKASSWQACYKQAMVYLA